MASLASATVLTPGSSGAPDAFSNAGWTLLASTGDQALSSGTFTATANAWVYGDSANTFCTGCLDFVYMVARTGGTDPIERITAGSFAGFLLDAGVVTSSPGFAPNSVDRSANGTVVGFNYQNASNLTDSESTQLLVIQTNATSYVPGLLSVQDQQSANGIGFAPASVPEPISVSLLGGGLALMGMARWRRKKS